MLKYFNKYFLATKQRQLNPKQSFVSKDLTVTKDLTVKLPSYYSRRSFQWYHAVSRLLPLILP